MSFVRRLITLVAAGFIFLAGSTAYAQDSSNLAVSKIDRSVRESLKRGARTQRVIVTVKPGYRGEIRRALEAHGDVISSDSPFVDALAAEVHAEDVAELANHPWVELISDDAIVRSTGTATLAT